MTLNQVIQPGRPTVTELLENLRNGTFFVDDSFQRRLVWTERQKARLIQTVLMGYPMPEVYLWQQPPNPETGKQKHSIVDGQQRLTTLFQFTANEWALESKHLDEVTGIDVYRDKSWKDLDTASKSRFWEYVVNVRTIPSDVSSEQITDVFMRLNETDKSLNPQELRNAQFNGEFIKAAEAITELDEFQSLEIFRDSQVRRMADIEFTSSLLMFLRKGLVEENTKTINEVYDLYNDEYPEAAEDVEKVREFFEHAHRTYLVTTETRKFFTRPIHLFSLFCVEQILKERGVDTANLGVLLDEFVEEYQSEQPSEAIEQYRLGAASRTRSRASRNLRTKSLLSKLA
ncbi:DUF262 domain-containing protein [Sulfitobacter pseudonitzschiae]|uniref:DUF262 domain-containing protein n=1 Tax=Pseudosulfitobacter pseudonitzschiae TaxID=1402135 RepID=A0A9Q2NGR2_9RHOB|nr:DUF262 domain-containing protein [Pseudosulfitobacter pseudonitzschiae]MBM2291707.1 DUF262 domain-containing protein [Pseudosulfitobacter pseudonitzschiae]MBM2296625.1 DUF262 domain-containing protein [Pseudosulfitobacter pseudonitzschiae]MBM2301538.1 DUF262 domain-containing protein [Pseudosulfitobacter pseudonitzschiae]MBM2311322.1 DUF262 domain-containing protein [Pseudosulfitobacter pseudonitzschiae]MBM2316235.1 DUF262 domain-containing protein [Pseudosulfitobacter pseudonitzschiae]